LDCLAQPEKSRQSENPVFKNPPAWSPGTGTGRELLLQGFNWESSRDGRYYHDIMGKAAEIAQLGFTQVTPYLSSETTPSYNCCRGSTGRARATGATTTTSWARPRRSRSWASHR
jgi:hypothetical protein